MSINAGVPTNMLLPLAKSILAFTAAVSPIPSDIFAIGKGNNGQSNWDWRGPIFEILALGSIPDAATIAFAEGYMAWRNGTQAQLPVNHAFKTAAPLATGNSQTLSFGATPHDVLMTFHDGTQEQVSGKTGDYSLPYTSGQLSSVIYQPTSLEQTGLPLMAKYAGAQSLAFSDDFDDAGTIDNADTKADGFKWYRGGWFGGSSLEADQYSLSGSVLTLGKGSGASKQVDLKGAISANNSKHFVGNEFAANVLYFEARIAIDPAQSSAALTHFPAFWTMSREHISDAAFPADSWWGGMQASDYKRFGEFDIMEFVKSGGASIVGRTTYDATVHDWSGVYGSTGGGWPNDIYNFGQTGMAMGQAIDNQFHIYGGLIVQEKDGKPGYVQWMFDRKKAGKRQYFKRTTSPPTPPLPGQSDSPKSWNALTQDTAAETYAVFNDHHLLINLMTDSLMPMRVDWVKVWRSE